MIRIHRAARLAAMVATLVAATGTAQTTDSSRVAARTVPDSVRQPRTRLVILGVDHSAQLVSESNGPGMLSAFIDRVKPDVICIERPPEQAARGDHYEFTYEIQGVVLPYAAARRIEVRPIDWMPSLEDQKLAFGIDLDEPPEVRPAQGFQAFLTFPDSAALKNDLLVAEDSATLAPVETWYTRPNERAALDFSRRLFLYRTFLQAQRIRAVTRMHPGKTVLVVIGFWHKRDIERILSTHAPIELVSPSSLGRPTLEQADRAMTREQRSAILTFNLLGRQASTGNVDWAWVKRTLASVEARGTSAEGRLFRVRLDEERRKLQPSEAARRYRAIASETPAGERFTWTGVKDTTRVDSYFDPFGNLTVRQRAMVEVARVLAQQGERGESERVLTQLGAELSARKRRQLHAYAETFVLAPEAKSGTRPASR